ncbi:hypothetical protein BgiBS90_006711 [Biomphalaria glabrata]|nr:hypothetical protein BgiBS90_006711 [Biomphalaria glabrata]
MPRRPSKKHTGKATVRKHWGAGGRGQGHHDKPDAGSQEEGGGHPQQHNCCNLQKSGMDDKDQSVDERQRKDGEEEMMNMVDHHIKKLNT